jgi:hypothetical protein
MKHIPPYGTIGAQYIQRQRWHPTGDDLRVQRALLGQPERAAFRVIHLIALALAVWAVIVFAAIAVR